MNSMQWQTLPDIDDTAQDVYETPLPELTEGSTVPTVSQKESDYNSDDSQYDSRRLDIAAARRRYQNAEVDTARANFGGTVAGGRHDYKVRSGRVRRLRRTGDSDSEKGELSSESDISEVIHRSKRGKAFRETVQERLVRLKRETAELQAELERRSTSNGVPKPDANQSTRDPSQAGTRRTSGHSNYTDAQDQNGSLQDAEDLRRQLGKISLGQVGTPIPNSSLEDTFISSLGADNEIPADEHDDFTTIKKLPESTISAIAAFSDRITAMETMLGISSLEASSNTDLSSPILPTLDILTTQIAALHSTLTPQLSQPPQETTANPEIQPTTNTVDLTHLRAQLEALTFATNTLRDSRESAKKSFEAMLESRDRTTRILHHREQLHSHAHSSRNSGASSSQPGSQPQTTQTQIATELQPLFLDSQAIQITALHSLLPTLQSMQPVLPLILERLRTLQVMHANAGEIKDDLVEYERRLHEQEGEIERWKQALEHVEQGINETNGEARRNIEVVAASVRGLEGRVRKSGM